MADTHTNRQNCDSDCEDRAKILDPEFAITIYLHSYLAKNSWLNIIYICIRPTSVTQILFDHLLCLILGENDQPLCLFLKLLHQTTIFYVFIMET